MDEDVISVAMDQRQGLQEMQVRHGQGRIQIPAAAIEVCGVEGVRRRGDAIAPQRLVAAIGDPGTAQPHIPVFQEAQHHLLVVAAQEDRPVGGPGLGLTQCEEPVDDACRIRTPVDIVAQEHEAVAQSLCRRGGHPDQRVQKIVQIVQMTVNIADSDQPHAVRRAGSFQGRGRCGCCRTDIASLPARLTRRGLYHPRPAGRRNSSTRHVPPGYLDS